MSSPYIYLSNIKDDKIIEGRSIFYTNDYDYIGNKLTINQRNNQNTYTYKLIIPESSFTEDIFTNTDNKKILRVTNKNFYELLSFFLLHNKFYFKSKFAGIDITDSEAKLLLNTYMILNKDFIDRQNKKIKSLPIQKSKFNITELISVLSDSNSPEGSIWRFTKRIKLESLDIKIVNNLIKNSQNWINKIKFCDTLNLAQIYNLVTQIESKTNKLSEIQLLMNKLIKKINNKCKIKSIEEIMWALFITNGTKIIHDI